MKKIKDLFVNNQLIQLINNAIPLKAEWINALDKPVVDLAELDNYLLMCLGDSVILPSVEDNVIHNIRTMINSNEYRLNKLWESVNFEYNPIDNYDRTETQTHNEKIETGEHRTDTLIGARSQTNTNGSYTDTTTNTDSNSAFDSSSYDRATTKSVNSFDKGSSTDSINSASATDTVTQQGYTDNSSGGYTLRARGNIGTMSTQTMIEQERKIVNYNFYDEVVKLFERYITCMVYEF